MAIVWTGSFAHCDVGAAGELSKVIAELRTHEALYQELDVRLEYSYESPIAGPPNAVPVEFHDAFIAFGEQQYAVHFVRQGKKFRADRNGRAYASDGTIRTLNRIRGFDGDTTRLLEQDAYGNIIKQPLEDENCVRHI